MASNKKRKKTEYHKTPIGMLSFPHLEKPRDYQGDEKFKYDAKLILDEADEGVADFLKLIDTLHANALDEAREEKRLKKSQAIHPPRIDEVLDEDGNVVPGKVGVKFSVKAKVTTRNGEEWDRKPRIFDAGGRLVSDFLSIGTGTMARISFNTYLSTTNLGCWFALQPAAVQVIELVKFGTGPQAADDFGFDEEDGFEAPAPSEGDKPEGASDDDEDGGHDDDDESPPSDGSEF